MPRVDKFLAELLAAALSASSVAGHEAEHVPEELPPSTPPTSAVDRWTRDDERDEFSIHELKDYERLLKDGAVRERAIRRFAEKLATEARGGDVWLTEAERHLFKERRPELQVPPTAQELWDWEGERIWNFDNLVGDDLRKAVWLTFLHDVLIDEMNARTSPPR
jgi:hypothetical protein